MSENNSSSLSILIVTLAIGLADHTWFEETFEMDTGLELDPDEVAPYPDDGGDFEELGLGLPLEDAAYNTWLSKARKEKKFESISIVFSKVIHWKWKE